MNIDEESSRNSQNNYKSIRVKIDSFNTFKEIKKELNRVFGNKDLSNDEVLRFLFYLAKLALNEDLINNKSLLQKLNPPVSLTLLRNINNSIKYIKKQFELVDYISLNFSVIYVFLHLALLKLKKVNESKNNYREQAVDEFSPVNLLNYAIEYTNQNLDTKPSDYIKEKIYLLINELATEISYLPRQSYKKSLVGNVLLKTSILSKKLFDEVPEKLVIEEIRSKIIEKNNEKIVLQTLATFLRKENRSIAINGLLDVLISELDKEELKRIISEIASNLNIPIERRLIFLEIVLEKGINIDKKHLIELTEEINTSVYLLSSRDQYINLLVRTLVLILRAGYILDFISIIKDIVNKLDKHTLRDFRYTLAEEIARLGKYELIDELSMPEETPTIYYCVLKAMAIYNHSPREGWKKLSRLVEPKLLYSFFKSNKFFQVWKDIFYFYNRSENKADITELKLYSDEKIAEVHESSLKEVSLSFVMRNFTNLKIDIHINYDFDDGTRISINLPVRNDNGKTFLQLALRLFKLLSKYSLRIYWNSEDFVKILEKRTENDDLLCKFFKELVCISIEPPSWILRDMLGTKGLLLLYNCAEKGYLKDCYKKAERFCMKILSRDNEEKESLVVQCLLTLTMLNQAKKHLENEKIKVSSRQKTFSSHHLESLVLDLIRTKKELLRKLTISKARELGLSNIKIDKYLESEVYRMFQRLLETLGDTQTSIKVLLNILNNKKIEVPSDFIELIHSLLMDSYLPVIIERGDLNLAKKIIDEHGIMTTKDGRVYIKYIVLNMEDMYSKLIEKLVEKDGIEKKELIDINSIDREIEDLLERTKGLKLVVSSGKEKERLSFSLGKLLVARELISWHVS